MNDLKIKGTIIKIGELQTFDSGFIKVEFVVKTEGDYPQEVKFESVKDNAEKFLKYNKVGSVVDVSFNIRGNEYQGKHYVNLVAWKVWSESNNTEEVQEVDVIVEDEDLPF